MTEVDRDEDLEQLMGELRSDKPYIEKPDELTVDVGGGCFLDRHRVCGADCTAYLGNDLPTAPERCAVLAGATKGLQLLEQLVQLGRSDHRLKQTPAPVPPPLDKSLARGFETGPAPGLRQGTDGRWR